MNCLNQIILEGNIVKMDYEEIGDIKFPRVNIVLAVDRKFKDIDGEWKSEVAYFDIEAYSLLANKVYDYGCKGRGIRVVGRLTQKRRTDDEGKEYARVYVVAEHIEFKPMAKDFDKEEE